MIEADTFSRLLPPVICGISIYMPIDTEQRDRRAPDARLRGLIEEAAQILERRGHEAAGLLDPLRGFLATADFAQHRDKGLALFVGEGSAEVGGQIFEVVSLPVQPDELVTVGPDFHIKPLLPLLSADRRFGILALSKANARLLSATPFTWAEVPLTTLPIEAQADLDSRQASEAASEDVRKELLVSSPRYIGTAVRAAIGEDPAPIVLVADPSVGGAFLQEVSMRQLHPEPLHLNPFALSDEELHARVLEIMEPSLGAELDEMIEKVNARLGTAEPTVAIRLEEILTAGREGRVDAVLVATDETLWGRVKPDGSVVAHGTAGVDDEDLVNLAALLTLRQGGRAFACPRERIPRQSPAVATLRF